MTNALVVDQVFIENMQRFRKPPSGMGLLQACSMNPVLFAERMLGIKPYAWQVQAMMDIVDAIEGKSWTNEFAWITSRQIGKSTAIAMVSIWMCVFNKYPGTVHENTIVGITSASDVQAKKLLYEVKKLLRKGDRYMEEKYGDAFQKEFFSKLLDDNEPNNTTTISFKAWKESKHGEYLLKNSKSGSVIKSYPPTSAVLGETFTVVIIDEAGMSDRIPDEFYYDFVYPTGNSTNAIRINASTPWQASGFFYRLVDPDGVFGDSPARKLVFDIDAIKIENPDYHKTVMKIVDQMNSDGKRDETQRAYYVRFVKGEKSYFDPLKVRAVFDKTMAPVQSYSKPCDMGIDFGGQVKSRTVITISDFDMETKTIRRLYEKSYGVQKDLSLLDDVAALLKQFNVQRIIPDDCPEGDHFIRIMKEKGWNVQPMNFRKEKVKKYGAFRVSLNKGLVKSYEDDKLRVEMLALEQAEGSKQSVIQAAPGYTDDLIASFVLSAYFFVQEENGVKTFEWYE